MPKNNRRPSPYLWGSGAAHPNWQARTNNAMRRNMTASKIKTGMDLREARLSLGLNMAEFGRALGMSGTDKNVNRMVGRYERDEAAIPLRIILLTECFLQGARPSSWRD